MWRIVAAGGTLVHAVAGTWSIMSAATRLGPGELLGVGLTVLLPGVVGLAVVGLVPLLDTPGKVFSIKEK
jgi:hypothetical protein